MRPVAHEIAGDRLRGGSSPYRPISFVAALLASTDPYGQNIDPRLRFKELKRVDCCPALRTFTGRPRKQCSVHPGVCQRHSCPCTGAIGRFRRMNGQLVVPSEAHSVRPRHCGEQKGSRYRNLSQHHRFPLLT
jgi:hypothetical protein